MLSVIAFGYSSTSVFDAEPRWLSSSGLNPDCNKFYRETTSLRGFAFLLSRARVKGSEHQPAWLFLILNTRLMRGKSSPRANVSVRSRVVSRNHPFSREYIQDHRFVVLTRIVCSYPAAEMTRKDLEEISKSW
ncbi:tryptophan synthase alpha chain [Striga asiatica]|uniref:Tryptophan synthase alpha chain n=1 Tax=Striga asiatica TaxID=4170 RepID=A0A5A7Q0C1_STRAF|nr:tryptophan synthase alpha chain [Striga asiatica]